MEQTTKNTTYIYIIRKTQKAHKYKQVKKQQTTKRNKL